MSQTKPISPENNPLSGFSGLVARVFWPKEMLDAIKELHDKSKLNLDAVYYIRRYTYMGAGVFLLLALAFASSGTLTGCIAVLLLMPLCLRHEIKGIYKRNVYPYLYGKLARASILRIRYHFMGVQKVFCETEGEKPEKVLIQLSRNNGTALPADTYSSGVLIDIYFIEKNSTHYVGMPDIGFIKNKYSLSV